MQRIRRVRFPWAIGTILLSCCHFYFASLAIAQEQLADSLPQVVSTPTLTYPRIALAVRVSGTVRLHVRTDGKHVVAIDRKDGVPMLIPSAEEYLRGWIFEGGAPASFEVTIEYKLFNVNGCQEVDRGVTQNLPTHVEIRDAPGPCDWQRFRRQQTYLREQHVYPVELHFSVDGKSIANPAEVQMLNGKRILKLPVKDDLFLVPEEFAASRSLAFEAVVGNEEVMFGGLSGNTLKDVWEVDLPTTSRQRGLDEDQCNINFDPLDGDGSGLIVTPCRRPWKTKR
jgi:hypothetical protein